MNIPQLYALFRAHPVITTDTRDCPDGSIFFALKGENFNGNDFALKALEAGCAYAVTDATDLPYTTEQRLIHVDNVLDTLQQLAHHHRRTLGIPILQITGTNGKTTTKELVTTVLSRKYRTRSTVGNFNNHIGVPKTLLTLRPEDEIAVVETGANHPGEIAALSRIVEANCGLITNVGMAHLEGFGSFEGVVKTKGELYENLRRRKGCFIFLHGNDNTLTNIAGNLPAFTYGSPGHGFDVEGEILACTPFLQMRWRQQGKEWHTVETRLIGGYNVCNALAAAAVGIYYGVTPQDINLALSHYEPSNHRSELMKTERNTLIVDAYNANPTSMKAALENFRLINHPDKMAILGEMRELGTASAEEHRKIVELAETCGCRELWLVGENYRPFAAGHRLFHDVEEVIAEIHASQPSGRLILVKGSNGTRLYRLPEYL